MPEFARRMEHVTGSAIRELFKLLADPGIISLGGGNPARESFPVEELKEIIFELMTESGVNLLQYGSTEGYMPLREAYLERIAKPKGIEGDIQNVLTLTGSMQGLDLLCKVFLNPGDAVLVESPTFLGALQAFTVYQAELVPVNMDDEGIIIDHMEEMIIKHHPKLFYCIPTFQNPTGKTLRAKRREQLVRLAEKHDLIIIEDDPYCDLRYKGDPVPPIKKFDEEERVVMLNSFSKIISPGIRVGCALGKKEIIRKMSVAKQCSDTHTPNLTQAAVAEFLSRGLLPGHLKRILPYYAERLAAMLDSMDECFPESCRYTRPEGGLFVWGELEDGINVTELFKIAATELKVAFIPGEQFFTCPEMGKNTFRFNFSSENRKNIESAIRKLGALFRQYA
ncbi:MAG: 2-aminoadipate transaminase [Firmicutes bacterium ADurb.Bin182]|nr:MAG: 2-aminoadipate transaminase [Firmicutes bacterium ADurb.Bin182]